MTHFILCHGFGFNPHFWSRLIHHLGPERCTMLDLGYYTADVAPISIPQAQHYIGIGHSLGLHKLYELPITYRACVGLNGFIDFLGSCSEMRVQRTKELKALRYSLGQNVGEAMTQFIIRCGAKTILKFMDLGMIQSSRLLQDLDLFMRPCHVPTHYPTWMVSAKNDPVVPVNVHEASSTCRHILMRSGLHSLGWSYSERIFRLIQRLCRD